MCREPSFKKRANQHRSNCYACICMLWFAALFNNTLKQPLWKWGSGRGLAGRWAVQPWFSVPSCGRYQCCLALSRPLWQDDPPLWGVPADGFITSLGSAAPLTISIDFTHYFSPTSLFIVMSNACFGLNAKSSCLNVSECHLIIWIAEAYKSRSSAGSAAGHTCWQAKNLQVKYLIKISRITFK